MITAFLTGLLIGAPLGYAAGYVFGYFNAARDYRADVVVGRRIDELTRRENQ